MLQGLADIVQPIQQSMLDGWIDVERRERVARIRNRLLLEIDR
jgi:hypothetical protein